MLVKSSRLVDYLNGAKLTYEGQFGVVASHIPWWVIRDVEKRDTAQLDFFPSELDEIVREASPEQFAKLKKFSNIRGLRSGEVRYNQIGPEGFPTFISIEKRQEPKVAGMSFTMHPNSSDEEHSYWFVSDAGVLLVPEGMNPLEKYGLESHTSPRLDFRDEDWGYPIVAGHALQPEPIYLVFDGALHRGWRKTLLPQERKEAQSGIAYGFGDAVVYSRPPLEIPWSHMLLRGLHEQFFMP